MRDKSEMSTNSCEKRQRPFLLFGLGHCVAAVAAFSTFFLRSFAATISAFNN